MAREIEREEFDAISDEFREVVQRRKPELFAVPERVRQDDGGLRRRRRAAEAATCVREATRRAEDSASGPAHVGSGGVKLAPVLGVK